MKSQNGSHDFSPRFDQLDKGLSDIKDSLVEAVKAQTAATLKQSDSALRQSDSIGGLKVSVDLLTHEIKLARASADRSVPIGMVALMFGILLVSIAGIEALKILPKWLGLL